MEYEDADDYNHAIANMDNAELMGRVLHVTYAKNAKYKEGTGKAIWADEKFILSKTQAEDKETEAK